MTGTPEAKGFSWSLVLQVALFCGVFISVAAVLLRILVADGGHIHIWIPGPLQLLTTVLLMLPITLVRVGWFGFIAGGAAASLLSFRRRFINSTGRLLLRAVLLGAVSGFLFIVVESLFARWLGFAGIEILFAIPIGCICGLSCALIFRKSIINAPRGSDKREIQVPN